MRQHFTITFLCIMSFFCAVSQSIKFEHYNDNGGLSHNSIRHIVQDKHGFLWIGTFSGLNRFDGYEFKTYLSTFPKDNKIQNDDITALKFDEASNNLWIGTRKGLTLFETDIQKFTTFLPDPDDGNSLPDEEVRAVYVDKFKRVWVGTKNEGLYMFFVEENRFKKIKLDGFNYIKEIFEDKNGNIWIGSYETASVAKITLNQKGDVDQVVTYTLGVPNSKDKNPYLNFIYEDAKSDIFVGTREGLYKLKKETNQFVNLFIKDDEIRDSLGPYFLSVVQAPDGKYWVGTLGGLIVCDQLEGIRRGNFKRHYSVLSDDTSLVDNLVSALYFDNSGVLWIGTEDGLDKYDPYENQFNINKDISRSIGNQVPRIRGFAKTYDNKVIVATRHNGLFVSKNESFNPLYNNQKDIASIYSIDGKTFYCGLWSGKVLVYNYVNNTSKVIHVGFEKSPVFAFSDIGNDEIMLGSFGEGAIILNTKSLELNTELGVLLEDYEINEIIKDTYNNIWFATETGVVKYAVDSKSMVFYKTTSNANKGLSHNNVSDIMLDATGEIWAATRKGISFFDTKINDFSPIKEPKELAGKWVTDMVTDANGDLWLNMNNNSISRLKKNLKDFNIYHVNSGNRLDVFSSSGFFNFGNSNIYLGGKNGIIYFSPYTIKENQIAPNPIITEFKIQNKEVLPGLEINDQVPLLKDLNETKSVELNYKNRNFSLQFSTPSYANEKLNKFEYMLEGFDKNWIAASSNSRTIQYTNLFPGDYVFKIKSSNSDGHWSGVVSYKIKITPPFWLTYKALVLVLLLLFLIFYFIKKEVKNRIRLKQELVTEKVNRERDIKLNNEKLRFFTNISHELRTPLTLILGPVKQLLEEAQESSTEYQKSRYNLIHQNASRLLNLVNQVLDFRKAQTGELKLKVSKTDILLYTKNTFDSFKELAYNKHIEMNFNTEDEAFYGWIDRDKYDKILYNLLSNAIKFTNKYGHVELYVRFKDDKDDILVIEVSDDGIGIPVKSQEKIFTRFYQATNSRENNTGSGIGLSLVKSLVELHKGTIKVQSTAGTGSVFTVEIPVKRNAYTKKEVFEFVSSNENEQEVPDYTPVKKITNNVEIKEKILVVEDNLELRKYLIDYLSDYYKVYEAENGEEGLQICRQIKPILCVADVMMPVKNGLEFCKELKNDEFISHIPVILLTALSENEDKVKGYDVGADGYLVKPFDPALLKTVIVNVIKTRVELKTKFSGEVESEVGLLTHSPIDKDLMEKITHLIEEHLSNIDLTTSFLCNELGMSSSKLYRKIKELTDLAPNEFIRTIRLKKSAQLLKSKKHNVSEVTTMVGFNDPLYFSRCFKKQFGFPPSKLLK
ncbi:hybrid sensor histidine kinase/response regulator transcription factor [Mariniflexile sp. AS56]|uniref:hybrid sensor histidine kinase/response regulator transcription factor n=1 Tax=Mariniflexile sp. AS56 TaxID=3063957 RepID=UPI0026EC4A57|nr:hybrid sensor histidine kinase/response regulator transcription factor [Mariniflexile sp. AS56]MDO7171667.1 two-component regulator propeller domain-containing protein [Mariniflexile sp. AS56]